MPESDDERIVSRNEEPAGFGAHHVRQMLVASLIGAIMVMIVMATVSFH